jgi:hypothetical protein
VPRFSGRSRRSSERMLIRPSATARPAPARRGLGGRTRPREPWARADPERLAAAGRADGRRPGPHGRAARIHHGAPRSAARARKDDGGICERLSERLRGRLGDRLRGRSASSSSTGAPRSLGWAVRAGAGAPKHGDGRTRPPMTRQTRSRFEPGWSGAGWYVRRASGTFTGTIEPQGVGRPPQATGPELPAPGATDRRRRWILGRRSPGQGRPPSHGPPPTSHAEGRRPRTPEATWTGAGIGTPPSPPAPDPVRPIGGALAGNGRPIDWRSWFDQPPPGSRFPRRCSGRSTAGLGRPRRRIPRTGSGWPRRIDAARRGDGLRPVLGELRRRDAARSARWSRSRLFLFVLRRLPRVRDLAPPTATIATFLGSASRPRSLLSASSGGAQQRDAERGGDARSWPISPGSPVVYAVVRPPFSAVSAPRNHAGDETARHDNS